MSALALKILSGDAIVPFLSAIAQLRITVFSEYPYLYEGSLDYEKNYLRVYTATPRSIIVLALDGEHVVGASTGLPMLDADKEFQTPFQNNGYDLASIFYFGESVLLPAYRGQGIGHQFFDQREAHAKALGFGITTFCAVDRPEAHPMRPANYRQHDVFWNKRGYSLTPSLHAHFSWQEIGETHESRKRLNFWLKQWK